jgi:arylsulfatase A-like enzyme
VGHGDNLKSMVTLRVPFAIKLPARFGAQPRVDQTWVSQLDIYPTLLSLLGERPVAVHEGIALLDRSGVTIAPPADRVHFAETGEWLWTTPAVPKDRLDYPPITGMATLERGRIVIDGKYMPVIRSAKHRAAFRYPYKLTYEPRKSSAEIHLYRIDQDPMEEHDIREREPQVAEELAKKLRLDVLRHAEIMDVRGYFVSRPPGPPEED